MKRILTTLAAATVALALTGCGIVGDSQDEQRLEHAWNETTTEDREAICMGVTLFPEFTQQTLREMSADPSVNVDPDVAVEFITEKCAQ